MTVMYWNAQHHNWQLQENETGISTHNCSNVRIKSSAPSDHHLPSHKLKDYSVRRCTKHASLISTTSNIASELSGPSWITPSLLQLWRSFNSQGKVVTVIRCGRLFCVSLILHYLNDIPCKNCNYTFVFVKVIPKTLLVPFFSRHGVLTTQSAGSVWLTWLLNNMHLCRYT